MKKLKMRKLSLHRETLGPLEAPELSKAQGGVYVVTVVTCTNVTCLTNCNPSDCNHCLPDHFTEECTAG